jgi:HEAT repeats
VKKWVFLGVVLVLGGGFFYARSVYLEAGNLAEDDGMREMDAAAIRDGLLSDDPRLRMDALAQIEKLPPEERAQALLAGLDSGYAPTRLTVVTALAADFATEPDVVAAMMDLARDDPDPDVRDAAFNTLTASGDTAILELAVEVLSSTDASLDVKARIAALLDRLTGRAMGEELSGHITEAQDAADDLSMEWDDWLSEHREGLRWDAAAGRFTGQDDGD